MSTKLITFVCVLTLALASSSYGSCHDPSTILFQGDVCHDGHFLLGNWEMPGNHNGWQATGDYDGWTTITHGVMIGYDDWSTLDFDSLKIVAPSGWVGLIELRLPDPQRFCVGNSGLTLEDAFFANDTFNMDIKVNPWMDTCPGCGPCTGGANLQLILNSDGIGWYGLGQVDVDIVNGGIYHMSLSYAHLLDGDIYNDEFATDEFGDPLYTYLEFVLAGWTDAECPQEWIIDHAYLTPEPTTIALLGLGGLALIRKRR